MTDALLAGLFAVTLSHYGRITAVARTPLTLRTLG
jgi:hypothetical protein